MRPIDADKLMESIRKALGIKSMMKSLLLPSERTIIDQIDSAPTIGGWISVKDRLPSEHDSLFANHPHFNKYMWAKESNDVIVYVVFPDGTGRATEGRLRDGKWNTKISPALEPVITYWMPMPEPPEGGKKKNGDV